MGVLIKVLYMSQGDVIEMGAGPNSTPLLHWLCKEMGRTLITYENNPLYHHYAMQFRSPLHKIVFVEDWDSIDTQTHRGVVFIDHAPPARRGSDAIRFKDSADFVVLHDTEDEQTNGYEKVWLNFSGIFTWKACRPWVSVVSNLKDLAGLHATIENTHGYDKAELKNLLTVLYYTSNREDPEFEKKIIENLKQTCGDLPIISISQKPIDLGKNICVGDVGHSYINEWRQILIGAKEAKTPYVICAESDHLYPPEYFTFVPPQNDRFYRYNNIWVVFKDFSKGSYRRKACSEGAQVSSKEFLINLYEKYLDGKPEWINARHYNPLDKNGNLDLSLQQAPYDFFKGDIACIGFKTGMGISQMEHLFHDENSTKLTLPYWGYINDLRAKYL